MVHKSAIVTSCKTDETMLCTVLKYSNPPILGSKSIYQHDRPSAINIVKKISLKPFIHALVKS